MKKSTKALMLSTIVYPGSGHILLKRHITGIILIVLATGIFYILASHAITTALQITDKIINGEVQPDLQVIRQLVSDYQTAEEEKFFSRITTGFIAIWLIGILDCYRIGRTQDRKAEL